MREKLGNSQDYLHIAAASTCSCDAKEGCVYTMPLTTRELWELNEIQGQYVSFDH